MSKSWKTPPEIKVYEALGAVYDGRVALSESGAKVFSSSENKAYDVEFDPKKNSIMVNDNGSYWKGYLGYPAVAYLMLIEELPYNEEYGMALSSVKWKDVNTKNKNDFDKTLAEVRVLMRERGVNIDEVDDYTGNVLAEISRKNFSLLGKKKLPPKGY